MSARERILAIRLLEKVRKYPAYAQALGIECEEIGNGCSQESINPTVPGEETYR